MVDTCYYTCICIYGFVQTPNIYNTRVNCHVNCGLWGMMMCQCMFTNSNRCTILVSNTDNGVGYACMGAESTWQTVLSILAMNLKLL